MVCSLFDKSQQEEIHVTLKVSVFINKYRCKAFLYNNNNDNIEIKE